MTEERKAVDAAAYAHRVGEALAKIMATLSVPAAAKGLIEAWDDLYRAIEEDLADAPDMGVTVLTDEGKRWDRRIVAAAMRALMHQHLYMRALSALVDELTNVPMEDRPEGYVPVKMVIIFGAQAEYALGVLEAIARRPDQRPRVETLQRVRELFRRRLLTDGEDTVADLLENGGR